MLRSIGPPARAIVERTSSAGSRSGTTTAMSRSAPGWRGSRERGNVQLREHDPLGAHAEPREKRGMELARAPDPPPLLAETHQREAAGVLDAWLRLGCRVAGVAR